MQQQALLPATPLGAARPKDNLEALLDTYLSTLSPTELFDVQPSARRHASAVDQLHGRPAPGQLEAPDASFGALDQFEFRTKHAGHAPGLIKQLSATGRQEQRSRAVLLADALHNDSDDNIGDLPPGGRHEAPLAERLASAGRYPTRAAAAAEQQQQQLASAADFWAPQAGAIGGAPGVGSLSRLLLLQQQQQLEMQAFGAQHGAAAGVFFQRHAEHVSGSGSRNPSGGGALPLGGFARTMSASRSDDHTGGGNVIDGDDSRGGGTAAQGTRDRNRAAQRRFRERQRARVETLESRCVGMATDISRLEEEIYNLRSLNSMLERMLALNEEHIAVLSDAAGVFTHAASGALPPPVQAALMRFAELRGGSGAAAATVATEEGRQALLSEAASRGALAALLAAPAASLQKMAFDLAAATCAGSSPVSSCHSGALADAAALLHLSADTSVAVAQAPFEPSSCNFQDLQQPAAGGSYGSYSGAGTAVVARGSAAALAADPAAAAPPLPSGMALLMVLTPDVAQRLSVPDVVGMWRELVLSLKRLVSELDCLPDAAAASPQLVGAVLQHVQLLAKLCGVVSCVTPRNMMGLIVADMTDVQGQPAAPGLSTPQHWAGVVGRLQLSNDQTREIVAARERLLNRIRPLLIERQQLGLQLAQTAPSGRDCRGLSLNSLDCHSLAARLKDNLTAEHLASMELNLFVFNNVLSLVGVARAAVYSYPLFPDALAIANVVADVTAAAVAAAPR